jgi:hypothetical protein
MPAPCRSFFLLPCHLLYLPGHPTYFHISCCQLTLAIGSLGRNCLCPAPPAQEILVPETISEPSLDPPSILHSAALDPHMGAWQWGPDTRARKSDS